MSDASVSAALRSNASLVVVEAPAGCGKTHQGAEFARDLAEHREKGRLLILTHTHAACSVFAGRVAQNSQIEIRTIDSLVMNVASAYHHGLGLPKDVQGWVRQRKDGYAEVAQGVAQLLHRHHGVAAGLTRRYPIVVCDEHQDSSPDQHAFAMAMHARGAKVRVFGDPMQRIFKAGPIKSNFQYDWKALSQQAEHYDKLDTPHRWSSGSVTLGNWTLQAREALKAGKRLDLRGDLPEGVNVVFAENQAQAALDYQLNSQGRAPIDAFIRNQSSLLILTAHNKTTRSLRSFFNRHIPLWEGHVRPSLDAYARAIDGASADAAAVASATIDFMSEVGKGFSASAFGNILHEEILDGCSKARKGKPAKIQGLARILLAQPDHRGAAQMLARIAELRKCDKDFAAIEIDGAREFWEAIHLGDHLNVNDGLAEITKRRTFARPTPPARAISTIHKAKGLECDCVVVMPCDKKTFADTDVARCLLYVALTRAKKRLMLVVSKTAPSPLFEL